MPIDRGNPGDMSVHSHSGDCNKEFSGKYAEYIEEHWDALVAKCERVNNCIKKLLTIETFLLLVKKDDFILNKTCSLIYENSSEIDVQSGQCTSEDREDIREDLEQHLSLQFADAKASRWKNVKKCLSNNYGDSERSTYVNDICRLAQRQPLICENRSIHQNVTTFLNNHIQHLWCTCRSLQNSNAGGSHISLPAVIGGFVGGFLLLLVICAIICICYRPKKSQKSKKRAPNVIYLPAPNGDNYPIYQELLDDKAYNGYGKYPSGNPPNLPMRYTTQQGGQEDEPAYLEPVEAGLGFRPKVPIPGQDNPSYGAPPEYSEIDLGGTKVAVSKADSDKVYFQPLPSPPKNSGFDKDKPGPDNSSAYETLEAVLSSAPTEDASKPEGVSPAPIPAKRTSSDRQGGSRYVNLEQDQGIKPVDTTV